MPEYETIKSEAERLGVSYSTVKRWVEAWKPFAKPGDLIYDGRTIRIRHEALCEFLWERRNKK